MHANHFTLEEGYREYFVLFNCLLVFLFVATERKENVDATMFSITQNSDDKNRINQSDLQSVSFKHEKNCRITSLIFNGYFQDGTILIGYKPEYGT